MSEQVETKARTSSPTIGHQNLRPMKARVCLLPGWQVKPRKITSLKDLGTKRLGDEKADTDWGLHYQVERSAQGLDIQMKSPDKTVVWQNVTAFRNLQVTKDRVNAGEGIGFVVL